MMVGEHMIHPPNEHVSAISQAIDAMSTPTMATTTDTTESVSALIQNRVGVDMEPDVKSNQVSFNLCSCAIVLHCFSREPQRI
jgi:hypothetical protein